MAETQPVLIGTKVFSNDGIVLLKAICQQLRTFLVLTVPSSVYRIEGSAQKPRHIHDLKRVTSFEGLAVCFRGTTQLPALEVLDRLVVLEESFRNEIMRRSASLNLLVYGSQAFMTPRLTLPHPEFHVEPEQLIPAAEVWPDCEHPVLHVKLQSLLPQITSENKVEFFAQGKSLVEA